MMEYLLNGLCHFDKRKKFGRTCLFQQCLIFKKGIGEEAWENPCAKAVSHLG